MSLKESAARLYLQKERESWNALFSMFGKPKLYPQEKCDAHSGVESARLWAWAKKRWKDFPDIENKIRDESTNSKS